MQRLGPPHWPDYPPGAAYGALYDRDRDKGLAAARLGARLIAADLAASASTSIACRSPTCRSPAPIRWLATAPMATSPTRWRPSPARLRKGLAEGGVLPVLKHIPGHGRATADSHESLPVVNADRATLEATDFAAFRPLEALAARR